MVVTAMKMETFHCRPLRRRRDREFKPMNKEDGIESWPWSS